MEERTLPPPPLPVLREGYLEHGYPRGAVPGPPPPKSWSGLFRSHHPPRGQQTESRDTVAFRKQALSLVFSHTAWSFGSSDVPLLPANTRAKDDLASHPSVGEAEAEVEPAVASLTQICLRVLLAVFPDAADFREELLEVLPPMFRRDILRYTAVHDPLPNGKLYPLFEPDGHVDGEVIVVGPQATLQRDLFASLSSSSEAQEEGGDKSGEAVDGQEGQEGSRQPLELDSGPAEAGGNEDREVSWEEGSLGSQDQPSPLHTLVVLNAQVPPTTLFLFPLTLTRLALLALPVPSPQVHPSPQIHRLPRVCPLLEVLDLSYNPWVNEPPGGKGLGNMESTLDRIEWEKWARLRVLGLRMCNVPKSIIARVNRGRLGDDVDIVGLEVQTFGGSFSVVEGMMKSLRLSD